MASLPDGALTKRLLIDVSHSIEQYALAGGPDEPTLVIAMFQRLSYFMREVEVYRQIAERGAITIVGIAEDYPPSLPTGIAHVLLDPAEPLAGEWSVTVLCPRGGSTLVAIDLETVNPESPTLESGRQFDGGWSFLREHAYYEALRLRDELRDRLHPETMEDIDEVLRATTRAPGRRDENRTNASMHLLTRRLAVELNTAAEVQHRWEKVSDLWEDRDSRTGLRTGSFMQRWLAGAATGTLPMGLLLLRVHNLDEVRRDLGDGAELAALRLIGERLQAQLDGADRAVVLSETDFLLLLPSRGEAEIERIYRSLLNDFENATNRFPYVPLHASAVGTVTRLRPLPLPSLVQALTQTQGDSLALVP